MFPGIALANGAAFTTNRVQIDVITLNHAIERSAMTSRRLGGRRDVEVIFRKETDEVLPFKPGNKTVLFLEKRVTNDRSGGGPVQALYIRRKIPCTQIIAG